MVFLVELLGFNVYLMSVQKVFLFVISAQAGIQNIYDAITLDLGAVNGYVTTQTEAMNRYLFLIFPSIRSPQIYVNELGVSTLYDVIRLRFS